MTPPESQNWIDAIKAELDALVENDTWGLSTNQSKVQTSSTANGFEDLV